MMQSGETSISCFSHCCISQASVSSPGGVLVLQSAAHMASLQMYNDFTLWYQLWVWHRREREKQRKKARQAEIHRAEKTEGWLWLKHWSRPWWISVALHQWGTSIRPVQPSAPHAQSSLVNHLHAPSFPIVHNMSALSSSPTFTSFHSNPLHLLRFPPNPCIYVPAVVLQKQQKQGESHQGRERETYRDAPVFTLEVVSEYTDPIFYIHSLLMLF